MLLVSGAGIRGLAVSLPLMAVWWRHSYPLHLRLLLLAASALVVANAGMPPLGAVGLAVALYLTFTVVLWGTVYYHLRLGAPLTNFVRFWRLVVENPDPTSGNLLEQLPKVVALLAIGHSARPAPTLVALTAAVWAFGAVVHRVLVTWVPGRVTGDRAEFRRPVDSGAPRCGPPSRKVLLIVIDGCRLDRLAESHTPFLDKLAAEGVTYSDCTTVYPARTVTGFASMLTGAPPAVHRMRSNFVPSLGVKCESIFDVIPRCELVGIAHLVDAFGDNVHTVTAVMPNDEIDSALCNRAREVVQANDPDVLVLQTLSVDQTGHFRGSFYDEYVSAIEATDKELERFVAWLENAWGGLDGVTIGVVSDHGQGRGIGGHGHWTVPERLVPCIWWGTGVPREPVRSGVSLLDVAATLCHRAGTRTPGRSVGRCLLCNAPAREPAPDAAVVALLPAHNEAETIAGVIAAMPSHVAGRAVEVIVVDDGSTDGTGSMAEAAGATVVRHRENRGLGAAIRSGLEAAVSRDAAAVAFLDADGEYEPTDLPALVGPVLAGSADYVVGSRFKGTIESMLLRRRIGNRVLTGLTSTVARHRLSDAQSGFRALGYNALRHARINHDYNYAQVLTLSLLRMGFRYDEVPIRYRRRSHGQSFVRVVPYLTRVLPAMARAARTR